MRVKMVVAYDGTNYSGWQIQPNGVTIEQKLNEALQALLGEDIRVTGASRTDAGVHSLGNVCIFDTDTRMPAEKISYALNQRLPEDIVVQDSCEVPDTFHPRFSRSRKTYEYRILNRRFRMPTRRLDTYFYHYPLDVEKMQEAADYLVGGLRCFDWSDDGIYQSGVCIFDLRGSHDHASIRITGCDA